MIFEIPKEKISELVIRQIDLLFLMSKNDNTILEIGVEHALNRCEYAFLRTKDKYYTKKGEPYFNPYHSGQYCIFLYYLSNAIFIKHPQKRVLADKVYYLNKALNACDLFYEVELPDIFMLDHPVGSVMGRATYGDYFSFSQHCTVGNNKGIYPRIGKNVQMMSGAKILGNCVIGDNVIISANTYIKDQNIPPNSIVFGSPKELIIKDKRQYDK